MKKKMLYNLGLAFLDFLVFISICVVAMLIITKSSEYLDSNFMISAVCISLFKVSLSYALGTYNLLWMYSIRFNLTKLI